MKINQNTGRLLGLLYLTVIVTGIFSELFVRSGLIVAGNAKATARNIAANEMFFRLGFVSDLIMLTFYFLLGVALYFVLRPVNKNMALLMVFFSLVSAAIMGINTLNHFAALILLSGAEYLKVFEASQLNALVMVFLDLHKHGYLIAQIFFGAYLFPLGYLIYKSGYVPKFLGIVLMLGCFGDLIDLFIIFLSPEDEELVSLIAMVPAALGEFSLCLWLLIKGIKIKPINKEVSYATLSN